MTNAPIDGRGCTVRQLFNGHRYRLDYYQREYKWESKQLKELVADLTTKFIDLHEPDHVRKDVAKYPGYFLGSIIISKAEKESYIVDGMMTRGFAFIAYPAEYRSSGVMTFIVDESGTIYEKDLGADTAKIAQAMTTYDPDSTWHPAE